MLEILGKEVIDLASLLLGRSEGGGLYPARRKARRNMVKVRD